MPYSPLELADAFIKAGELQEALDTLNQALADTVDDDAYRLRAELLLRLTGDNHLQKALDDLKLLKTPTPDDVMRRSVIHERMGDILQAIGTAAAAYRARPRDERFAERYLQLLMAHGRPQDAAVLLDSMPTTWRWQQWRGDVAVAQHDWQSARTYYETALAALEDDNRFAWVVAVKARLHFALAEACIQMGDYTHAGIQYAAAEHLVPNDPMIAFNRGLLAFAQGNSDEAVRLCKEAYSNANTTIQEHMAHTLRGDLRYNDFSTKVLG